MSLKSEARRRNLTVPSEGRGRPADPTSVEFHKAVANDIAPTSGFKTHKKTIQPRTVGQKRVAKAMQEADMSFILGPAGTGKTYLAIAYGISLLLAGKVDRLVLSRPAVEAGENLGFLPGDAREKIDPYLRPLWDAIHDMVPAEKISEFINSGKIEIAPLAFMRGRTLRKCFIVLDEAQNTTKGQLKMAMTRLGEDSIMAITGDPEQTDLKDSVVSGLEYMANHLNDVEGIKVVRMSSKDVVRHELVGRIIDKLHIVEKAERKAEPTSKNRAAPRTRQPAAQPA